MKKIAKFEKVSYEQFKKDMFDTFGHYFGGELFKIYNNIKLPTRATKCSAGYDFASPIQFSLLAKCDINDKHHKKSIVIPTGIRCKIEDGWCLKLYPRSSLGFKYRLQLDNTVGIIDGDYYYSDNEGHIFIKLTNCSNSNDLLCINEGDSFAQGIFVEYGIVVDDNVECTRNGGLGSTGK